MLFEEGIEVNWVFVVVLLEVAQSYFVTGCYTSWLHHRTMPDAPFFFFLFFFQMMNMFLGCVRDVIAGAPA